jgi:hypothetical protein
MEKPFSLVLFVSGLHRSHLAQSAQMARGMAELRGQERLHQIPGHFWPYRTSAHLLKRPVGRPSHKPKRFYASFPYRAGSWEQARRVVAKVERNAGELFPRVGILVTNLKGRAKKVVRFYNARGTAEQ